MSKQVKTLVMCKCVVRNHLFTIQSKATIWNTTSCNIISSFHRGKAIYEIKQMILCRCFLVYPYIENVCVWESFMQSVSVFTEPKKDLVYMGSCTLLWSPSFFLSLSAVEPGYIVHLSSTGSGTTPAPLPIRIAPCPRPESLLFPVVQILTQCPSRSQSRQLG